MVVLVSRCEDKDRLRGGRWELGTYNWRHMPHGDAGECCQFDSVGSCERRGGQGESLARLKVPHVPGGVMSVATANAMKVEWPPVC